MQQRDDSDVLLLRKVNALFTVNEEIIERIQAETTEVVLSYTYTVNLDNNGENFEVTETKKITDPETIRAIWCTEKKLEPIEDIFNDKIDYTCINFQDIIRLNKTMEPVARKFKFFDGTQSALDAIRTFLSNFELLHIFLGDIEGAMQDSPSRLHELQEEYDKLNEQLRKCKEFVNEVNLKQQEELQQKHNINELTQLRIKLTNPFPNELKNTLLTNHQDYINSWLPNKQFKMLYRGSVDGFQASNFHNKCNSQGETLVVIKSTKNYLFGGYTSTQWTSRNDWAQASNSFIFSLTNPHGVVPTKFVIKADCHQFAIYDSASYGPVFGAGNDLRVFDKSNKNTSNYTSFHSYVDTTGVGKNLFTGARNFKVAEIEVFSVKPS